MFANGTNCLAAKLRRLRLQCILSFAFMLHFVGSLSAAGGLCVFSSFFLSRHFGAIFAAFFILSLFLFALILSFCHHLGIAREGATLRATSRLDCAVFAFTHSGCRVPHWQSRKPIASLHTYTHTSSPVWLSFSHFLWCNLAGISESAISIPSCIIKRISRTRSRFCIGSS